jgi:hypothetical protein
MQTRSKNNIFKPKSLPDGFIRYPLPKALLATACPDEVEPTCYSQAAKHPAWRDAMNNEFDALLQNGTWTLIPPTSTMNIVGCKWVFRLKRKADGSIDRYKARLVVKGFHQQPGIDLGDTYSPVIRPTTIRLVLSLAISSGWPIRQIDVQNAFLHGWLSEDVYMTQPPGFIHPQFPQHICKLQKAIYGLKQAHRAWFSRLSDRLLELGFVGSRSDSSLFILHTPQCTTYILIYVDDILITSSQPHGTTDIITSLRAEFAIKDLGPLHFFLGMEAITTPDGLLLSQQRYILDLLKKSNMSEAKPIKTPMSTAHTLSLFNGDPLPDPSTYCSLAAPYNTFPLLDLTSPLLSTKSPSFCIDPPLSIFKLLNGSYATSNLHSPSVSFFASHPLALSKLTLTLTGLAAPMIGNPSGDFVSFLALISSHGPHVNKELLPNPAPNPNIVPLQPLLPSSYGSNPYSANLVSFSPHLPLYGVTTLAPHTSPPTLSFMLEPNILKSTFTSFVTKSPPRLSMSDSSLARII